MGVFRPEKGARRAWVDLGGESTQNGQTMVRTATPTAPILDARQASLVVSGVVVLGLIISLLLVAQA